jgi:hypothetical protein
VFALHGQRLWAEARLDCGALRGAEAPLFHGAAMVRTLRHGLSRALPGQRQKQDQSQRRRTWKDLGTDGTFSISQIASVGVLYK